MPGFSEGAPCWADVSLPDLAAGRRFYGQLFGWTFHDQGEAFGHYTMAHSGGKPAAALMAAVDPAMPTAWGVHFASDDAAATADRIREAGGQVLFGPDTVGDSGVMLGALDPGGSFFGVWQAGSHPGFAVVNEPGAYCWTENHTKDAAAVDPFYEAVFGYEAQQIGDGTHFDYKVWSLPGTLPGTPGSQVAGRMQRGGDLPADAPAAYQTYFVVDDCDAAAETVRRLGGQVMHEPHDSPFGRTALVADDQGAGFAVIDVQRTGDPGPGA
ncbi:VOC family protein [Streptomyces sp. V4-01]|uniref:VOC family protein n=1 Tax=Actinacidiphila polyblastidii TaxID=3110430 RepID=A0ABU7PIA6_9ACTN|nr:VOC family protein [Streptomyces sp. V4-01]